MDRRLDPRSIVTPYAFSVHPDLLGLPLATPWQRLGAILVDLVVIGLISRVGWETLGFLTTLLLIWLAIRKPARDTLGKVFRVAVGCLGAAVLGTTILVVVIVQFREPLLEMAQEGIAAVGEEGAQVEGQTVQGVPAPGTDAYEPGVGIREGMAAIAREALASHSPSQEGPDPTMAEAPPLTADPDVADTVTALEDRIRGLEEEMRVSEKALADTRQQLAAAEDQGVLDRLWNLIDDLGLGLGWAALYMTIIHAWWRGASVGKKLFRIRVVMIDKRPLNWWLSFERAGGYAAGFATGMLGFAQVLWDPNRQAIHDKVSETIVIQDGKEPVPGPWIAEGKAQWKKVG